MKRAYHSVLTIFYNDIHTPLRQPCFLIRTRPFQNRLSTSIHLVELPRSRDLNSLSAKLYASHIHKLKTYLTSRPLSSYRQMHGMSSPPIGSHIPQSTNVIFDLPPQLVLYLHVRQVCRKCCYRLVVHISDSSAWEDVMFGEDP